MFEDDVWRYMPLGPVPSLVLAAVVTAAAVYVAVVRSRASRVVAIAMLGASVAIVFAYTARGALSNDDGGFSWRLGVSIRAEWGNVNRSLGLLNVFGNVAMFMPIGWFVAVLSNRRPVVVGSLSALLLSASVEVWQMLSGSAGDVDDLLLNGFGGFLGAGAATLLRSLGARSMTGRSEAESRNVRVTRTLALRWLGLDQAITIRRRRTVPFWVEHHDMTKVLTAPWEPYGPGWPCLKSSSCGRLGLVKTTEVEFRLNVPVLGLWRR